MTENRVLQPSPRPDGSSQVLRFIGALNAGAALATYPKVNGTVSSDEIAGQGGTHFRVARFLLADTTNLLDLKRQLPDVVFDDSQPAGASPHVPTTSGVPASLADILNANDLDITQRTWCQNTYVTVVPLDSASAATILAVNPTATRVCLDDGASSGLGTSTGYPVMCLAIDLGALPTFPVNLLVQIEVRQSAVR